MEGDGRVKINSSFHLEMDIPRVLARFDPRFQRSQAYLDNEVLKDTEPYVPFRTGILARSGQNGTRIGSGEVIYNAPYARSCYYATNRRFRKDIHPQATAQWFEKSKAVNNRKWVDGVNKVMDGGI